MCGQNETDETGATVINVLYRFILIILNYPNSTPNLYVNIAIGYVKTELDRYSVIYIYIDIFQEHSEFKNSR